MFIFQVGSDLTTATSSSVVMLNDAQSCQVFRQVGSSATLGTDSTFVGTIMALTSITANTGATVEGRALARNGSVTLDNNVLTDVTVRHHLHHVPRALDVPQRHVNRDTDGHVKHDSDRRAQCHDPSRRLDHAGGRSGGCHSVSCVD